LNYVQRVPLGVVAQITPFNHPLLIAVKKIAPALAAGNSVIIKPSELAPLTVLRFAEMAADAGVPAGVLNVLSGGAEVAKRLVENPIIRKAGTATGRDVGAVVGRNLASYTAELGGNTPIVVFHDADIESAVNGVTFSAFIASGQTCVSGTRLILQCGIWDTFMEKLYKKVNSITNRIGNPLNPKSSMGTVISDQAIQRLEETLAPKQVNVRIVAGGYRLSGPSPLDGFDLSGGCFFPPTVIEGAAVDEPIWQEEIFGPVLVVNSFDTEGEAIQLANSSRYGLGAGIWTSDLSRAHRISQEIEAGLVWVNTHHRNDPSSPWGGMKDSGIGRENGLEAYESYSQSKSIIVNIASAESTRVTDDWFTDEESMDRRYG